MEKMASIDGISISGSGLGQAAGKAGAGPVTGFDLLFAVSTDAAVPGEATPLGLGPIFVTQALPSAESGGDDLADIELFLGLQPKAAPPTAATAAESEAAAQPEPVVEILTPVVPVSVTTSPQDLPIVITPKIALIAPEQGTVLAAETTGDEPEDVQDPLSDKLDDPDAKQAVAAPLPLLIPEPAKPLVDAPRTSSAAAAPPPQSLPPAPQIQSAKPKAVRAEPLAVQSEDDESPAPALEAGARPIARLKIDLAPSKPLATPSAEGRAVIEQQAKDQPAMEPSSGRPLEPDLPPLAAGDRDADQRQPHGPKAPQSLPSAPTALDPVQTSPLRPAAVAVSTAPLLAQLRQTLDTRDAVWRERLVDQVVGGTKDRAQSITVMLRPKSLGDMQLQIEIGASDTAVRIVTETASAARLMLANEDLLSQLMDQSGVRLASLTAQTVGQAGFGNQSLAQNSGGQGGRDSAALRKERVRNAEAGGAKQAPSVTRGDTSKSSINLMA
jgi:flagellar hook-length control protein FliK